MGRVNPPAARRAGGLVSRAPSTHHVGLGEGSGALPRGGGDGSTGRVNYGLYRRGGAALCSLHPFGGLREGVYTGQERGGGTGAAGWALGGARGVTS